MPDARAAAVNTHAKQRQTDFIMRTCGLVIESLPQDMKGGLVGDEDRSAKPARFLFEIAVMISAARVVDRVCKGMAKQDMRDFVRQVAALPVRMVGIVMDDDALAGVEPDCGRRKSLRIRDRKLPNGLWILLSKSRQWHDLNFKPLRNNLQIDRRRRWAILPSPQSYR